MAKRTRYYQSMLDTSLLATGTDYDELNDSYIIFICPFDPLGGGRHIYTFRACCIEDKSIQLGDGATRIFLNTKGTMDDVRPEVRAFLEYVNGVFSNDSLVQEIDAEIRKVKNISKERVSYMTYLMKMQEERKEGIKEGKLVAVLENVKSLMQNMNWSPEQAMQALNIPENERGNIVAILK